MFQKIPQTENHIDHHKKRGTPKQKRKKRKEMAFNKCT
jgi:hypothetical protein